MIDVKKLRYKGKLNYQNGLSFYFKAQGRVISFYVANVYDKKKKIKVTMQPDPNHKRAHVHVDKHDASFAIDTGELLAGQCDNKTCSVVGDWINKHRQALLELWDIAKNGADYKPMVEKIQGKQNNDNDLHE